MKEAERRILDTEKMNVQLDKRMTLQEAESKAFKEGQERIENLIKATGDRQDKWNEAFDKSLREVREVKPKP